MSRLPNGTSLTMASMTRLGPATNRKLDKGEHCARFRNKNQLQLHVQGDKTRLRLEDDMRTVLLSLLLVGLLGPTAAAASGPPPPPVTNYKAYFAARQEVIFSRYVRD